MGSVLAAGTDDIPLGSAVHEYEEASYGTRMRSTFTLPAVIPEQFLDSLRQHNIAEMGRFPEFLPQLHKQKTATKT